MPNYLNAFAIEYVFLSLFENAHVRRHLDVLWESIPEFWISSNGYV